ncbi:polyprenyl synthetase family protein [Gynuella sunshinyii]|nr:polyprenyl synthetase family protein [Gynuella sunshinyii]
MDLKQIIATVQDDFQAVDHEVLRMLDSRVPLIEKIAEYIISSGGKRLRPLIVLLVAKASGYQGNKHIKLATLIEFIHTATLLHDDVVDTSDLRRGRPTANAKWGNAPSVLVGDFLYSRAFENLVHVGDMDIMATISKATSIIAEGEVLQLINVGKPETTEEDYLKVIHGKTATLFEASSLGASFLGGTNPELQDSMQIYGLELGMAFQIIDDVLDYIGNADELGKNVGDDLAEGKPTLPLIKAMEFGSPEQRSLIADAISNANRDHLEPIVSAVRDSGALEYCIELAETKSKNAIRHLMVMPASIYRDCLESIAHIAVQRKN